MTHDPAAPDAPEPTTPEPPAAAPPAPEPAPPIAQDPLRGSLTSGLWAAVIALGVVLILLIVFIVQNTQDVEVTFFGWEGTTPLAVALLVATVAGLFLAASAGSLRILQLRRRVKRDKR
ncbi:MAG: lipopolysaccharide assembly protein LapA domain-containing protein [Actinomycetota bacterium]|nr:lipopolysaccharide assembly protein LapA domain-containing protein [Actinomycetota bacterium]